MDHIPVSLHIHAENSATPFQPKVHGLFPAGHEGFISIEIDIFTSLLLSRKRLHELTHVLVKACAEYPLPIEEV